MTKVEISDYPIKRNWESKVFAIPNIPRGNKGFPVSLKYILESIKNNKHPNSLVNIPGSSSKGSLETMYIHLRPTGIVNNPSTGWEISKVGQKWLETGDNLFLAAILNANVKFFSEILYLIKKGYKYTRELIEYANNEYYLNWKTKSEMLGRLNWLKDLNLIYYEDFTYKYYLTKEGAAFLKAVGYVKPTEIKTYVDKTTEETEISLSPWAWEMCKLDDKNKSTRKTGIGYIPGQVKNIHNTILEYLQMMNSPTEFVTILEYSTATYKIAESSTRAFISTLINLNFIMRKTKTLYEATELGRKFPTENLMLDFACCLNNRFSFFFEILFELEKENLTTKELAVTAKVSFGFPSQNTNEINKRLHVLRNAKLIKEVGVNKYNLTHRGKLFVEKLRPFYQKRKNKYDEDKIIESDTIETDVDRLLEEIRLSSVDSSNPSRFEKAVKKSFLLLGFKADLLGGAGNTDVLIEAPTTPRFSYSITIDAKTNYTGKITEGHLNFDTLAEHKIKHNSDYSLIIGPEFQGKRLFERAIKNEVALINVEDLELLIRKHLEIPLKSDTYKKVFQQNGPVNLEVIEEKRNKIWREGQLLQLIMKCLFNESDDPYTEGIMQPREIYILLKSQNLLSPTPTLNEIKQMLEFLSSPLIGSLGKTKDGYYALGSLTDAAHKFSFYLKACRE